MPNGVDFDFEDAYGKPFRKMTREEKDIAVLSQLYYLRQKVENRNWMERIGIVGTVTIPFLVGWLAWLTKCLFEVRLP